MGTTTEAFHVINMFGIILMAFLRRTFQASVVRLSRREGWINEQSKPTGPCFPQTSHNCVMQQRLAIPDSRSTHALDQSESGRRVPRRRLTTRGSA